MLLRKLLEMEPLRLAQNAFPPGGGGGGGFNGKMVEVLVVSFRVSHSNFWYLLGVVFLSQV